MVQDTTAPPLVVVPQVPLVAPLLEGFLEDLEDHHQVLVEVPQEDLVGHHQAFLELLQEDLEDHHQAQDLHAQQC